MQELEMKMSMSALKEKCREAESREAEVQQSLRNANRDRVQHRRRVDDLERDAQRLKAELSAALARLQEVAAKREEMFNDSGVKKELAETKKQLEAERARADSEAARADKAETRADRETARA